MSILEENKPVPEANQCPNCGARLLLYQTYGHSWDTFEFKEETGKYEYSEHSSAEGIEESYLECSQYCGYKKDLDLDEAEGLMS